MERGKVTDMKNLDLLEILMRKYTDLSLHREVRLSLINAQRKNVQANVEADALAKQAISYSTYHSQITSPMLIRLFENL